MVDLTLCRQVTFDESDVPECDALTSDLLTGYLDIALSRGREQVTIYDPLAALTIVKPEAFTFENCKLTVSLQQDETYGKTYFDPCEKSLIRRVTAAHKEAAQLCLSALATNKNDVS